LSLLDDSLRFEAFLRDFHPDKSPEISVLTESVRSGVLFQFLQRTPIQECAASLSARSGISPRYSDWAMDLWSQIIPESAMVDPIDQAERDQGWIGTVEDVLGKYKEGVQK
jgi:hypothetical protein